MIAEVERIKAPRALALKRHRRPSSAGMDIPRIEAAVREILLALGENPDREG